MNIALPTSILIGGGIVLPICLVATSDTRTQLEKFVSVLLSGNTQISEVATKVTCSSKDISDSEWSRSSPAYGVFIKEQKEEEELYKYVSCSDNTAPSSNNKPFLGKHWEGLFPKDLLSNRFSLKEREGQFEMNVKSSAGKHTVTTFSNSENSNAINARWIASVDTRYFSTSKVIKAAIEESGYETRAIYLLLKTPDQLEDYQVTR